MQPTGYLTDCTGKPSSTRLLVMLTVPAIVLIPLFVWAKLTLEKGVSAQIDPTVIGYIVAANGIILTYCGFKAYQEPTAPSPAPKPPAPSSP